MNEVDLIREVEKRPILYDKSVSGFNKTKMRDDAWREVQDSLQVSEAECKKRWRSLRDSFIKLQRTHGGRTRWPYHHAMKFLLPHIDVPTPKASQDDRRENNHTQSDDSDDDDRSRTNPEMFAIDPTKMLYQNSTSDDDEQPTKRQRTASTEEEPTSCSCNRTDPDELFLLSCAPTLKRLNSKRNAVARLKIQQVLYEAEFGVNDELPYVTPGSECGYEINNEATG